MKVRSSDHLDGINAIVLVPTSATTFSIVGQPPKWLTLLGRISSRQQLILNAPDQYLDNFLVDARQFWLTKQTGVLFSGNWIQSDMQGMTYPLEASASFMRGKPVLLVQLITERYQDIQRTLQLYRETAIHQAKRKNPVYKNRLTQLYNYRGFLTFAQDYLSICRQTLHPVTIASIDIGQLRLINYQHGGLVGNQAIINAARLFQRVFRHSDLLGHNAGGGFLVLMINTNARSITRVTKRHETAIKHWNTTHQDDLHFSFSMGFAADGADQLSLKKLIHQAEMNRYAN